MLKSFAVKANTISKTVVIHKFPCGHIRKRGGIGKYGQVKWEDFENLKDAENWAKIKERNGLSLKYCSFCHPNK